MALFAEYSAPCGVVFTSPALSLRKTFFLQELIMAGGWAKDGAVQDQIDASVEDAVLLARSRLPQGESRTHCEECNAGIPEARRKAVPGVRLCVTCQAAQDAEQGINSGYNRRGSKDSQLR
jgi:phage/conjugal plasmid C-4 type zinc finger TraR family protein